MLCGNPLYNLPMLDVSCGNEAQAWAINRAKEAISRGDEAAAREHVAPLVRRSQEMAPEGAAPRQPVHH